jgi:hypothetical protein
MGAGDIINRPRLLTAAVPIRFCAAASLPHQRIVRRSNLLFPALAASFIQSFPIRQLPGITSRSDPLRQRRSRVTATINF